MNTVVTGRIYHEIRVIKSSEIDWYRRNDSSNPFLWHLVAAEHIEMLKMGTYRKNKFSNQVSPLDQKFRGLDGSFGGSIGGHLVGGSVSGRLRMSKLGKSISPEERVRRASVAGRMNAESGHIQKIQKENLGKGGLVGGKKNAESGHCARIAHLGGLAGGKKGSTKTNHLRWHVDRGVIKFDCVHCQDLRKVDRGVKPIDSYVTTNSGHSPGFW